MTHVLTCANSLAHRQFGLMKTIPKLLGFRPPKDVAEQLARAELATGAAASDLMIRCIRMALPQAVQQVLSERQAALMDFQSNLILNEPTVSYKSKPKK